MVMLKRFSGRFEPYPSIWKPLSRREIRGVYWYLIEGEKRWSFSPPKLFFADIFFQSSFTLLIFLRDASLMLSASFKYIEHCSTTSRKFSKAIWKFAGNLIFRVKRWCFWHETFFSNCLRKFSGGRRIMFYIFKRCA